VCSDLVASFFITLSRLQRDDSVMIQTFEECTRLDRRLQMFRKSQVTFSQLSGCSYMNRFTSDSASSTFAVTFMHMWFSLQDSIFLTTSKLLGNVWPNHAPGRLTSQKNRRCPIAECCCHSSKCQSRLQKIECQAYAALKTPPSLRNICLCFDLLRHTCQTQWCAHAGAQRQ